MATTDFCPIKFCGFKVSKSSEGLEIQLLEETSATRDGYKILETPIKEIFYASDDNRYIAKTTDDNLYGLVLSPYTDKQSKQNAYLYILDKYFKGKNGKKLLTEEELWKFEGYKQDDKNEKYWVV